MAQEPQKGKIHIDSDWKAEAEAAKDELVAEEQAASQGGPGTPGTPGVADLINLIAMPAMMAIGGYRMPDGQTVPPDLTAAKYHIDLLGVLEEKTKGNLADEESQALATLLHQLRMQFSQSVAQAAGATPPPGSEGD